MQSTPDRARPGLESRLGAGLSEPHTSGTMLCNSPVQLILFIMDKPSYHNTRICVRVYPCTKYPCIGFEVPEIHCFVFWIHSGLWRYQIFGMVLKSYI